MHANKDYLSELHFFRKHKTLEIIQGIIYFTTHITLWHLCLHGHHSMQHKRLTNSSKIIWCTGMKYSLWHDVYSSSIKANFKPFPLNESHSTKMVLQMSMLCLGQSLPNCFPLPNKLQLRGLPWGTIVMEAYRITNKFLIHYT